MLHSDRISKAKQQLSDNTALLISDPLDIYFLTGFICLTPEEREAFVLLSPRSAYLFLTAFSAPVQIEGLTVHVGGIERMIKEHMSMLCQSDNISSIAIDGNSLRYSEYELVKSSVPAEVVIQTTSNPPLQQQRMIKDQDEIKLISQANHITHQALQFTFDHLQLGMSELDVQEIFEHEVRKLGTKQFAFPTIVAFGTHSALPHHQPFGSAQGKPGDLTHILKDNTAVLIDCGVKYQGYCADVTRTMWFGNTPDPEFSNIESIVKNAYGKTLASLHVSKSASNSSLPEGENSSPKDLISEGELKKVTAAHLDKVCRDFIIEKGYGQQFIHTTGHGVGLYIHEQPSLNQRNTEQLKPGMVITIEPGIYLPDKFGFRFENSILLTENGYQELL